MQYLKFGITLMAVCYFSFCEAQQKTTQEEVDIKSYALYEKGSWKELLQYGRTAVAEGHSFQLLRLRIAYAAFILGNFSEAILQYDQVLKSDSYNATAHYYTWLCYRYLNQKEIAGKQVRYLSNVVIESEKIKKIGVSSTGFESSYKVTEINPRGNSFYTRVDVGLQLGYNITMQQSGAVYNQIIREPKFQAVNEYNNIDIRQKEYYNKLTMNLGSKWQAKLVYHYLYTPFNNFIYNNHVGLLGIKYYGAYFDLQANAMMSRLIDSTGQQFELQLGLYPLGNMNLYFLTTGMLRSRNGAAFNAKEVVGFKVIKNIWIELNGTFGRFKNLLENDALYVYNAIDANTLKAGATLYYSLGANLVAQVGYTYEKRELYLTTNSFNQYSITGGLSWKM